MIVRKTKDHTENNKLRLKQTYNMYPHWDCILVLTLHTIYIHLNIRF